MMSGPVLVYGRGAAAEATHCGCDVTRPGGPLMTRVGPLLVTSSAPCSLVARIGGLGFAAPCPITVQNVTDRPVAIMAQSHNLQGRPNLPPVTRGRGIAAAIASLPNTVVEWNINVDTIGPMRLDPGQSVELGPPPAGGFWTVVDIDPRQIPRAAWIAGGAAVVVGAGVVYGGYKAVQAITHRRRR